MTTQYPVLAYGTLRPSGGNYDSFFDGFTTDEETVRISGFNMHGITGYPYLTEGTREITATLIQIREDVYDYVMTRLDRLEGYKGEGKASNHYDRKLHSFELDGETVEAWIYIASPSVATEVRMAVPVIESGDWIEHEKAYYAGSLQF